ADAHGRTVLQNHAPRALHLDREQVERVLEPADLELLPVERAGLDGAAVVVRHQLVVAGAAADPHALVRKSGGAGRVAVRDQVARPAVERNRKLGAGKARARNNRLEIAGQKSLGLTQASDADGLKILLEESAGGMRIPGLQGDGLAADARQGVMD